MVLDLQSERVPIAEGEPHPAENDAAGVGSLGHEAVGERVERAEPVHRAEVDEVAELGVTPRVEAQPTSEVGLHRRVSERQEAYGRRSGNDPQAEVLGNLGAVDVHVVVVDAGHRPLVVAEPETHLEVVSEVEVPRSAHCPAVEVVEPEGEDVQVLEQDVAVDPAVEAPDRELPGGERDGVLRERRPGDEDARRGDRGGGARSPGDA